MENKVTKVYSDDDIKALPGLLAVRVRPGMYIGSTASRGLHHLVWEIVDNSIDEVLAGVATQIDITITKDNEIVVVDNGRGIPTGMNKELKKSTVEVVFTELHAGGKFGGGGYKVSGGLHGVGASVVNALSEYLECWIDRDGKRYYIRFERGGEVVQPLQVIGQSERVGTTVKFKPDAKIFTETTVFEYDLMKERIRQLAFLNKGVTMTLTDQRVEPITFDSFHYEGGLMEYVKYLNRNRTALHNKIIYCDQESEGMEVEIACQYNDGYQPNVYSFCNNIYTQEGGTHEEGFRLALTRLINQVARNNKYLKDSDENLTSDDVREGLTAVISIKHPNPQYEGQTKTKLGNSEIRAVVSRIFGEQLSRYLLENPDQTKVIIEKSLLAAKARVAAKKARELTRKSVLGLSSLPGKLADCSSTDASKCEIFIVEGDSAGGSAKQGRDRMYQAILPLRGKIINVEKAQRDRVFDNQEIGTMITAFGTGIDHEFDAEKLRYHKIVLMTDADVDGSHIRVLLLTFFYRYLKPLIEQGYVYIAQPPLYKVSVGKTIEYAYNDAQMAEIRAKYADMKMNVQRYKGLGEMDAEQLWETTMNPQSRILLQVTLHDAMEADMAFDTLMGEKVEPRRDFILANAKFVKNLDI